MAQTTPKSMQAVAIDRFGGPDTLKVRTLPVPEAGTGDIVMRVESAGVGPWDAYDREGMFAKMLGIDTAFPYVLGIEGAGTVVSVGQGVQGLKEGDRVYGMSSESGKRGGFYAQYALVKADDAWPIPGKVSTVQAGAMPVDAATALRGVRDALDLKSGESLVVFGASGGIGHMAIQFAKRIGARVLAIASGDDGVALAKRLGADAALDGHTGDIAHASREFAPGGIDAALITAGGEAANRTLSLMRRGGRAAYPNGVRPEPETPVGVGGKYYNADRDPELMEAVNSVIEAGPFEVHIGRTFSLDQVVDADRALNTHFLGRLALLPSGV